jgi:hypothetical protein
LRVGLRGLRRFVRLVDCLVIDGCDWKHAGSQGMKNGSGVRNLGEEDRQAGRVDWAREPGRETKTRCTYM